MACTAYPGPSVTALVLSLLYCIAFMDSISNYYIERELTAYIKSELTTCMYSIHEAVQ